MWADISNDIKIFRGIILYKSQEIGYISDGAFCIKAPNFRIGILKEYDQNGLFHRITIEQFAHKTERAVSAVRDIPLSQRPFLEVRNMQLVLFGDKLLINTDRIVAVTPIDGNWAEIETTTGSKYKIDFNVKRIHQKLKEESGPPKP